MRFKIAVRSVILAPEVNMLKPLPVGFAGQQMTYQIAATDPQGETITVTLKVSDGKGGEALQTYLTGVHADPVNRPPVIVTTPTTRVTLPTLNNANSTGAVEPGALNLTLDAGEKTIQTVTINVENQALLAADIVFIVDESGSMGYGHHWIQNMVESLDQQFAKMGVNARYAIVGYGNDMQPGDLGRIIYMNNGEAWGTGTEASVACSQLVADDGWYEDGYEAIDFAIKNLEFRVGAAKHFILLSDEDRDNDGTGYGPISVLDADMTRDILNANNITLHTVVKASFTDGSGSQQVLGGKADGTAFITNPNGEYSETDGLNVVSAYETTVADYVDFVFHPDIEGTSWNIGILIQGGDIAKSFSNAFAQTLVWNVLAEFEIDVISSDPNIRVQNITGIQAISKGKLIFEVEITGDGNAHQFDLEFINVKNGNNTLIGSIPASIRTGYAYDVDAIDPDNDELFYSLVGETHGATINPHTGILAWNPSVPGDYTFTVNVIDGRGGKDVQTWTVNVQDPSADNNDPTLQAVETKTIEVGSSYEIPIIGNDIDGDTLRYFLVMNPDEGLTYPDNLTINRQTGVIQWSPEVNQVGQYKIRVQAVDGRGGSVTQDFIINVVIPDSMVNHLPVIESEPASIGVVEQTYLYQIKASDPDGHTLSYKLMHGPDGMFVDEKTGTMVWCACPKPLKRPKITGTKTGFGTIFRKMYK